MRTILSGVLLAAALAVSAPAFAQHHDRDHHGWRHHHRHQVCFWRHHHRVCYWR